MPYFLRHFADIRGPNGWPAVAYNGGYYLLTGPLIPAQRVEAEILSHGQYLMGGQPYFRSTELLLLEPMKPLSHASFYVVVSFWSHLLDNYKVVELI